jgi:hypothetical protein
MGHHQIRVNIEGTNLFTATEHEVRTIEVCGTNPLLLSSHEGLFFVQLSAPKKIVHCHKKRWKTWLHREQIETPNTKEMENWGRTMKGISDEKKNKKKGEFT